ncbi:unnamed protein product [Acanthosepion pharaonis]|uniref:Uncharacterized protein n=1 Tax=Acanthosepion pharaonis TaxID=158019 RepID=A0A812DA78_ACAPH|nr:unnamed protein product [Sepia pharaonis]
MKKVKETFLSSADYDCFLITFLFPFTVFLLFLTFSLFQLLLYLVTFSFLFAILFIPLATLPFSLFHCTSSHCFFALLFILLSSLTFSLFLFHIITSSLHLLYPFHYLPLFSALLIVQAGLHFFLYTCCFALFSLFSSFPLFPSLHCLSPSFHHFFALILIPSFTFLLFLFFALLILLIFVIPLFSLPPSSLSPSHLFFAVLPIPLPSLSPLFSALLLTPHLLFLLIIIIDHLSFFVFNNFFLFYYFYDSC